ncbi:MAG: hypothetical protein HY331_01900 [Chloroflexi bacterium]|nr:hypothetical protein [Chloroflexota bacterium]
MMYLVVLGWKTPWSVEQQVLEATTVEAARALAARYKRPGIQVRIYEVSRELPLEPPAEPEAPATLPSSEPIQLAPAHKAE